MSLQVYKFLSTYFICKKCKEIPSTPILLKCNHLYCLQCLSKNKYEMEFIKCSFCLFFTETSKALNFSLKLLIDQLLSLNDKEFESKYQKILLYIYFSKREDEIIKFFLKIQEIMTKQLKNNGKKSIYLKKRKYKELIKDNTMEMNV